MICTIKLTIHAEIPVQQMSELISCWFGYRTETCRCIMRWR